MLIKSSIKGINSNNWSLPYYYYLANDDSREILVTIYATATSILTTITAVAKKGRVA